MKSFDSTTHLTETDTKKDTNKTVSENGMAPQSKTLDNPADLWQAIKKIVILQNQAPRLEPIANDGPVPTSFPQERLWSLYQLEPESSAYNLPFAFQITGPLNLAALKQSFLAVLQRHESLRTQFSEVQGIPVQTLSSASSFNLNLIDLQSLGPESQAEKSLQIIRQQAEAPFNLETESLLRAALIQCNKNEHILVIVVHHIVFDGWSEGILFSELGNFYNDLSSQQETIGEEETLSIAGLDIQYSDFSAWQRQWLKGDYIDALVDYWQQKLAGDIQDLKLPSDHPRPARQVRRSKDFHFSLPESLTQSLKSLSLEENTTLFVTLLAAFKVLLYRYTDQSDLLICSPIANRNRSELQKIIGYFANLIILRSQLNGELTFKELLEQERQVVSGAFAHQDLPIQTLASSLNSSFTLPQVMFVFQNTPRQSLKLSDLELSRVEVDNGIADFDLSLSMQEESGKLTGVLKYNTDLFIEATVIRFIHHFQTILENLINDVSQSVESLLPLTAEELEVLKEQRHNSQQAVIVQLSDNKDYDYVAASGELQTQLVKIWENLLNVHPIGVKDNFFELGGRSLLAVRLVEEISKSFNIQFGHSVLFQAPTVEKLAHFIQNQETSDSESTVIEVQTHGNKPPLFFIQVLGEGLEYCLPVSKYLGHEQPVYGLSVGILSDSAWDALDDVVGQYIKDIRRIQPKGPYFLVGAFCGGRTAYKIARELEVQGEEVAALVLLNTLSDSNSANKRLSFSEKISAHWQNFMRIGPSYLVGKGQIIINRLKSDLLRKLYLMCQQFSISPPRFLQDFAFRDEQAKDKEAERNLKRKGYIGKKVVIKNNDDKDEKPFEFNPPGLYTGRVALFRPKNELAFYHPDFGWGKFVPGQLDCIDIPGNFYSMFRGANGKVLASALQAYIEQASHGNSSR
jgi:thioesterase domain-containing protein/acyl carrier protein